MCNAANFKTHKTMFLPSVAIFDFCAWAIAKAATRAREATVRIIVPDGCQSVQVLSDRQ